MATANLGRRCTKLELAHPPQIESGANSLEIHNPRLLKSRASRQEKSSVCNGNGATSNEHFRDVAVFERRAGVNAAGSAHLNSLLDDDGLAAGSESMTNQPGDGAA